MTTPSVCEPASSADVRAGLIDGISVAMALAAHAPRVRLRHVERALALTNSPTSRLDALLDMLGHFAGAHAPLPWTRAARRLRGVALDPLNQSEDLFPEAALGQVASLLMTSGEAFEWASPDRYGLGAALHRAPEGHLEDARLLLLAMVGVTSLECEPMVTHLAILVLTSNRGRHRCRHVALGAPVMQEPSRELMNGHASTSNGQQTITGEVAEVSEFDAEVIASFS